MEAIKILNNYRLSLSNDKYALLILTNLFRSGALSELEISSIISVDQYLIKEKLKQLYKAQLICIVQQNKWVTTDLAEEIISRLGILEAVSKSILNDLDLDETDKSFLEACIEFQATKKPEWSRYQASILRSIDLLKTNLLRDTLNSKKKRSQLCFSSIVGMDTDIQQLGEKPFSLIVIGWHESQNTDLWRKNSYSWKEDRNTIISRCRLARKDFQLSNQLMLFEDEIENKKKFTKRSYGLTLARVIGALSSYYLDNGFVASSKINKNFSSAIWDVMENEYPNINEKTNELFYNLGKIENVNLSSWEGTLKRRIKRLLTEVQSKSVEDGISELLDADKMGKISDSLCSVREKWIEGTLERFVSQINEGHFDNISLGSLKRIKRHLELASDNLTKRLLKSKYYVDSNIVPSDKANSADAKNRAAD